MHTIVIMLMKVWQYMETDNGHSFIIIIIVIIIIVILIVIIIIIIIIIIIALKDMPQLD